MSVFLYIPRWGTIFAHWIFCVMQVRWGICQGWIHLFGCWSRVSTWCSSLKWWSPKACVLLAVLSGCTQDTEGHGVHRPRRSTHAHIAVAHCTHTPSESLFNGSCCTIPILICGLWTRSANLLVMVVADRDCGKNCLPVTAFLHPWRKMEYLFSLHPPSFLLSSPVCSERTEFFQRQMGFPSLAFY